MLRTQQQNIQLHTLLTKLGIDLEGKEELVSQYTNGRTVRSSEMRAYECEQLIRALNATQHPDVLDKKRKRVISHLREAGYVTPDGRADMPAIHQWALRQKHKTPFNQLNSTQLSELITAAEGVKNHYLSRVR